MESQHLRMLHIEDVMWLVLERWYKQIWKDINVGNVRITTYDDLSHHTCCVCINFIHKWWNLQFNSDSARQIFERLFMGFLFSL